MQIHLAESAIHVGIPGISRTLDTRARRSMQCNWVRSDIHGVITLLLLLLLLYSAVHPFPFLFLGIVVVC